jgi:hypothetical protein
LIVTHTGNRGKIFQDAPRPRVRRPFVQRGSRPSARRKPALFCPVRSEVVSLPTLFVSRTRGSSKGSTRGRVKAGDLGDGLPCPPAANWLCLYKTPRCHPSARPTHARRELGSFCTFRSPGPRVTSEIGFVSRNRPHRIGFVFHNRPARAAGGRFVPNPQSKNWLCFTEASSNVQLTIALFPWSTYLSSRVGGIGFVCTRGPGATLYPIRPRKLASFCTIAPADWVCFAPFALHGPDRSVELALFPEAGHRGDVARWACREHRSPDRHNGRNWVCLARPALRIGFVCTARPAPPANGSCQLASFRTSCHQGLGRRKLGLFDMIGPPNWVCFARLTHRIGFVCTAPRAPHPQTSPARHGGIGFVSRSGASRRCRTMGLPGTSISGSA